MAFVCLYRGDDVSFVSRQLYIMVITWLCFFFLLTDHISHMVFFVEMDPKMPSRLPLDHENFPLSFGLESLPFITAKDT